MVLGLPAVVGTIALLLVTRKGVYASPDSAFYVGTARNLLDGDGLTAPPGSPPLSHFPPLFSLVLASLGWVSGLDPLDAAGLVNAVLLGVTAVMVAVLVHRKSGSVVLGVAASASVVVAVDLLVYYGAALSEPLFIVLVLGAIVSLAAAVEEGSRWAWVAAAALSGGACLTRYLGVALVVAEVAVLVMVFGRRALGRALAFGALSLAPLAVWLAVAGRGNRPVVVHLFDGEYWMGAVRSLSRWVLPSSTPWPVGVLVAALAAGVGWLAVARPTVAGAPVGPSPVGPPPVGSPTVAQPPVGRAALPGLSGRRPADAFDVLLPAFAVAYLAMLVVDRVFLDATGRLDLRFFAVLHVVAVIGVLPWLHRILGGRARAVAAVLGLGLLAVHVVDAGSWVVAGLTDDDVGRRGLTAQAWQESPVLAAVVGLPPGVPVYSNAPEAVFLLTGRATSPFPAHTDYLSDRRRPAYAAELAAMGDRLEQEDGVVVWLRPYAFRQRFVAPVADLDVEPVLEDEVATLSRPAR